MGKYIMKNDTDISKRVMMADDENKFNLRRILSFVYGQKNRIKKRMISDCSKYLTDVEYTMANALANYVVGPKNKVYGVKAVRKIKKAKYKCENCNENDIRCLEVHHLEGKTVKKFKYLCANCHKLIQWKERKQKDR